MNFEIDELPCVFVAEVAFENVGAPGTGHGVCISKDCVVLTKISFSLQASVLIDDMAGHLTLRLKVSGQLYKQKIHLWSSFCTRNGRNILNEVKLVVRFVRGVLIYSSLLRI